MVRRRPRKTMRLDNHALQTSEQIFSSDRKFDSEQYFDTPGRSPIVQTSTLTNTTSTFNPEDPTTTQSSAAYTISIPTDNSMMKNF